jgi:branched-chain amino acid transport system permease protein
VLRVINIAQGEIYMLGAMLLWTLTTYIHLNFFVAMAISVVAVGLFGIVFYRVSVKPLLEADPLITMLSTMAMSFILMQGAQVIWNVDARNISTPFKKTIGIFGLGLPETSLALCAIGCAALIAVHFFLTKTTVGKAMRATAQDKVGASLVGIDIRWIFALTMILGSALAAICGGILGPIWVAHPRMGEDILLKGFSIVVIGGMGNLRGCIITAFLLGVTEALFSQYISMYYRDTYAFGIMVLVLLIRPQGLFARI